MPIGGLPPAHPIQDVDDYLGEVTIMEVQEGEEGKQRAVQAQKSRQQAWLKRKTGFKAADWRPKKRYRTSADQYSVHEHHQMSHFLDKGLLHFQLTEEDRRGPAASWPRLSVSPDQGSDGVSAIAHWLHLGINVDPAWDFSHGVQNDIWLGLGSAGLGCHIAMALIRINIPNSPI